MALQFTEREFIPVLLGGDINAYSVARAFYEEYQVKSLVFGKYQTGPAYRSQIIDYTPNVDIDTMPVMIETVNGIAPLIIDFIRTPPTFIRTCADECGNPIP